MGDWMGLVSDVSTKIFSPNLKRGPQTPVPQIFFREPLYSVMQSDRNSLKIDTVFKAITSDLMNSS